jgi:uncharacterized protein
MAGNQTGSKSGESSNRGFASMDEGKQRDIASKGGRNVPDNERSFAKDRELASEAGRKGGEARGSSASSSTSERTEDDSDEVETAEAISLRIASGHPKRAAREDNTSHLAARRRAAHRGGPSRFP